MHRIARGHRARLDANDVQGTITVAISAQLYLRALHKELDDAVPAGHHRIPAEGDSKKKAFHLSPRAP